MINKVKKINLKNIPVYEHLDECLKCTYEQRLEWLKEANEFVCATEKARKQFWKKIK